MGIRCRWLWLCFVIAVWVTAHPGFAGARGLASVYGADVLDVIDGDTLRVRATVWLGLDKTTLVRVNGIDAPELRGQCDEETRRARAATAYVRTAVAAAGNRIWLTNIREGKFAGRVVADVFLDRTLEESLAAALVAEALARPYDGRGRRRPWCPES